MVVSTAFHEAQCSHSRRPGPPHRDKRFRQKLTEVDKCRGRAQHGYMRPEDVQVIGTELAIKWPDGSESFIPLAKLRQACPCAGCQGERDVLGKLHRAPAPPLVPASFQVVSIQPAGSYGLQPLWADGHHTGIYSFEYLRRLGHG
jgi:DUF971 family protein